MKTVDLRLPRITPKDVLDAEPCLSSEWDSAKVHAFFRRYGKREYTIKDVLRLHLAKALDMYETSWLLRHFSPKIFIEMVIASIRNRSDGRKMFDAYDYDFFVYFSHEKEDDELLQLFVGSNHLLFIDMVRWFVVGDSWH